MDLLNFIQPISVASTPNPIPAYSIVDPIPVQSMEPISATVAAVTNALPTLADTLGTMLLGVLFATFLQGMLTVQLFVYFERFEQDHWTLKLLVMAVWSLDLMHLGLISDGLYHYTVTNWGNPNALPISTWQLDSHVVVTGLTSFLCQSYFLKRLYFFSEGNWFLVIWPLLGAAGALAVGAVITVEIILTPPFAEFARTTPEATAMFSLTAATDVSIALLLCFYLSKRKTHFKRTQTLVRKVIKYTITTGLFTSAVAIASLIAFVLKPTTFVFFVFYFSLGSLYTNSLLANLNSRQTLRQVQEGETGISHSQYVSRVKTNPDPIQVMISTVTSHSRDHDYDYGWEK